MNGNTFWVQDGNGQRFEAKFLTDSSGVYVVDPIYGVPFNGDPGVPNAINTRYSGKFFTLFASGDSSNNNLYSDPTNGVIDGVNMQGLMIVPATYNPATQIHLGEGFGSNGPMGDAAYLAYFAPHSLGDLQFQGTSGFIPAFTDAGAYNLGLVTAAAGIPLALVELIAGTENVLETYYQSVFRGKYTQNDQGIFGNSERNAVTIPQGYTDLLSARFGSVGLGNGLLPFLESIPFLNALDAAAGQLTGAGDLNAANGVNGGVPQLLYGSPDAQNDLTAGPGPDVLVGGGVDTFELGNGPATIVAPQRAVETIDFSHVSNSTGSVLIEGSGGNDFQFRNFYEEVGGSPSAKLSTPFTVVWGGGSDGTTYNFNSDLEADQSIIGLNITGLSPLEFLNLDTSKLKAYLEQIFPTADVANSVVIVNPTSNDKFEFQGSRDSGFFDQKPPLFYDPDTFGSVDIPTIALQSFLLPANGYSGGGGGGGNGISVSDTAATVSSELDTLNQKSGLVSITLTDSGIPLLSVTASQVANDSTAFGLITNLAYYIAVHDTASNVLANIVALNGNPHIISVAISDSAANIASHIDALSGVIDLTAITLTDSGTPTLNLTAVQAVNDSAILGMITNASYMIAVFDSAKNVEGNIDALNNISAIGSITLSDGSPTLTLTTAQALGEATTLNKITNSTYEIIVSDTAANILANSAALNADPHVSSITVIDSASNILANSSALNADSQIGTIIASDSVSNVLSNKTGLDADSQVTGVAVLDTAANVLNNSAALSSDLNVRSITVDDTAANIVANLPALSADTQVSSINVNDTVADVSANIDALNESSSLTSITLTDSSVNSLTLTVSQAVSDTAALGKIVNQSYAVTVTDTASNVLNNVTEIDADAHVDAISIDDSASNVSANLNALTAVGGLNAITLTDTGTPALTLSTSQLFDDTTALSLITDASYAITLTDTASNVAADLNSINGSPSVTSISLSDSGTPTLTLTAVQAVNDAATLNKISNLTYAIDIVDSSANVNANIDALEANSAISSVTLTNSYGQLSVNVAQALGDGALLSKVTNTDDSVAISDTAGNVAANIQALQADTQISGITVTDTAANILANIDTLRGSSRIRTIKVVDTAANVLSNSTALQSQPNITSISVRDTASNVLSNSNALHAYSQIGSVTVVDTASNVAVNALGLQGDSQIGGISVIDSAANVSAKFDALNEMPFTSITLTDSSAPILTLTAGEALDDVLALGMITNKNYVIAVDDTTKNVENKLNELHNDPWVTSITLTDSGAPALTVTVAQALNDGGALSEIANTSYSVLVSDTAANVLNNKTTLGADTQIASIGVADSSTNILADSTALSADSQVVSVTAIDSAANVLADETSLRADSQISAVAVVDSAANVLSESASLGADSQITSITVVDTAANVLSDSADLGADSKITSVKVVDTAADIVARDSDLRNDPQIASISVDDTAANILANMSPLKADPLITSVSVVDTAAAIMNNAVALGGDPEVTSIAVDDTANDVSAKIDALNSFSGVTSVTLTDGATPVLALWASQALNDSSVLEKITNTTYAIAISDTAANVAGSFDGLNDDTRISSITLNDTGTPSLSLTASQALADTTALDDITNAGYVVAISSAGSETGGTIDVAGSHDVVSIASSTLDILSNAIATVSGDNDAIILSDGASATITGSGEIVTAEGIGDTISMDSGSLAVGDGDQVTLNGSGNTISMYDNGSLTVTGTGDTTLTGSGDTISVSGANQIVNSDGTDDIISISSGTVNLWDNASATISGSNNSIALNSGNTLTITGSGDAAIVNATNNDLTMSAGSLALYDGSEATLNGDDNAVTLYDNVSFTVTGTGDTTLTGSGDTLSVSGTNQTVNSDGTGDTISISSGTVNLWDNASATISGSNNSIALNSGNTLTITGSGDAVIVNATNNDLTMSGGSLALYNGSEATLNGDDNAVTLYDNVSFTVTGTGDTTLTGSGDTISVSGTNQTVNSDGTGDTISISSGTVNLWDNASATISGSNNSIALNSGNTLTITGSGDAVIVNATNNDLTMSSGSLALYNGSEAALTGNDDTITMYDNGLLAATGTGDTVNVNGTSDNVSMSARDRPSGRDVSTGLRNKDVLRELVHGSPPISGLTRGRR